ncbi:MAG: zinc-ribbon domain-containing protein [Clostridia bacterium]|nr:zinc-ribbon domain-containing protein [Clostridia bacterium]
MICKSCGKIIPDDSKFCTNCGKEIEAREENQEEFCYCTNCGNKIRKDDFMCNKCCFLTGVKSDKSSSLSISHTPKILLILSIIASVVGLRLIGAILGIVGLLLAIKAKNKKDVRLGVVATVLCFVLCLIKVF